MSSKVLNEPIDISDDFHDPANEYFVAGRVTEFHAEKCEGKIQWNYHRSVDDWSFNQMGRHLKKFEDREIFWKEHEPHPQYEFSISFVSPRTFRLKIKTSLVNTNDLPSLMLANEVGEDASWAVNDMKEMVEYKSEHGKIVLQKDAFKLSVFDRSDKLLTETLGSEVLKALHHKTIPFLFVKRVSDYTRSVAASFSLFPGEKIYGCGESFTQLDKRGQKLVLFATDVQSAATRQMYKPVPFFLSNRGHGMFLHTSTPVTFDFGNRFAGSKILYAGDDELDLFFFIGTPQEILSEYTAITGRSPLPPLWSFGLWMSRFTYRSDEEVRAVANKLRALEIPCDVIHIDAGWFKNGINCDYEFDKDRFSNPEKLMSDLKKDGFRTSLWQLPYYSPANPVFGEVVSQNLCVKNNKGELATDDAVLDFSNQETRSWYTQKIKAVLQQGASVIKGDFGEAAPYYGHYASGRTGFYEHNLYPLRYNKLLHDITCQNTGEHLIWARSAWAGSQRYPVHWSGDPEVSDVAMAGTLRAGLSLGLSGFSFWSHDIGGFMSSPDEELLKRWAFFGLLTSHSRVHGFPPREPWEFSDDFLQTFRKIVALKYKLMPYVYSQAALASKKGSPLLKALLLNYPDDETAWLIEDEYLFGDDILVAPIFEKDTHGRNVYLPAGKWIDHQTTKSYDGGRWINIETSDMQGIMLMRYGSLVPYIELAQSTAFMDWSNIAFVAFSDGDVDVSCNYYLRDTDALETFGATFANGSWQLNYNERMFSVRSYKAE